MTNKSYLLYLLLGLIVFIAGCGKKNEEVPQTTLVQPNVEESIDITKEEIEDNALSSRDLIGEPGLQLNGQIQYIEDNHIIISQHMVKQESNETLEQELTITSSSILLIQENNTSRIISKKDLKIGDRVTYSFTIASTGLPTLYSLTVHP